MAQYTSNYTGALIDEVMSHLVTGNSYYPLYYFNRWNTNYGYLGLASSDETIAIICNQNSPFGIYVAQDYRIWINLNTGRIGINGIPNPDYPLLVNGQVGATSFVNTSDIRNKNVLGDLNLSVEQIASMPSVYFTWKNNDDKDLHVGSIALDWKKILPEVVYGDSDSKTEDNQSKTTLSLDYSVAATVSAINIAKEVVALKDKITKLEARIEELEGKLEDKN